MSVNKENKTIKVKQWLLKFLCGKNYLGEEALDYLAVNTEEHTISSNWHEHHVIQFASLKEWH